MKTLLLSGLMLLGSLTAFADFNGMEFKYADGKSEVLSLKNLTITVNGDKLTVSNAEGVNLSMNATNLASIKFVENQTSGIEKVSLGNSTVKAYDLNGVFVGEYNSLNEARSALRGGIYVLRNNNGETIKLVVR